MCDNENILYTSSVNTDLMFSEHAEEDVLVALVDEPFALEAAFNFFNDYGSLPKEILSTMSKKHANMFVGINDLPDTFVGSPKIVRSPVKRVANSTTGYTLDKFFSEKPELHPTFYFLDFFCGHDLIFFVQFENQIVVPVFDQLKNVLNGLHPTMFYKRKDGKFTNEKSNRSTIQKVIELCEKVGSIGISPTTTIYKQQHDQITEKQQQLIGIIDRSNASCVFQPDHLTFLNVLNEKYHEKV
ncbi:hypothetical protein RhiirA4_462781 [Rhizophagus irregularis]|uniref:Uncharacterized protein n=1 Tax=Rhizophagus irregularis TaxID=588596 RepID=A0A2I1GLP7_9GLOM|nr:hypothetical protein RhiirA4_462781 [Rhizophagus irregularis]